MKTALKWIGIVLGIIVLVIVAGAVYINASGIPSYPVEAPELTVQVDSAGIAEGRRLARMVCQHCHMGQDGKLSGNYMADVPKDFGKAWAPNITQSPNSRLAGYTDGELAYLLRTGIKRDGKYAPPWMPKFPLLSDEEVHNIIGYLRSDAPELQASDAVQPAPVASFLVKVLSRVAFKPLPYPEAPIVAPDPSDKIAFGRYLAVGKVDCYGCHSADFKTVDPMTPENSVGFFGGGNPMIGLDGETVVYSANITTHETGIGNWTAEQFIQAVK